MSAPSVSAVSGPKSTAGRNRVLGFYSTTVGKKVVMAVTGIIGILYVFFHMLGNLQLFQGAERIDAYSAALHYSPMLLWTARIILIAAVVLHVVAAYQLAVVSTKSRPVGYARWKAVSSDIASRTMRWTGPILLLFIIYHLLHLTTGTLNPDYVEGAVFNNVTAAFKIWWVSAIYIVSMLALGFHLYHGIWSVFQSIGASSPGYDARIRVLATILTIIIVLGFISIPVAVMAGAVE
ncbi:MAG TPA: succinate dehydrogenase cytochrome b subunit [Blastocatellia bacterium]